MDELDIMQKALEMMDYGYPALEQMPKAQKINGLGKDMMEDLGRIRRLISKAARAHGKKDTLRWLRGLDDEIADLKLCLRIACDNQYLPMKKYEVWSKYLVELGKMTGGWIHSQEIEVENDQKIHVCSECGGDVIGSAYGYTMKKYGRPICYACQKKLKNN